MLRKLKQDIDQRFLTYVIFNCVSVDVREIKDTVLEWTNLA
jgi:hypothetical protein